eukprot:CAMPEP_0203955154 /NCGR_PEP_ID=MMETSP0359-20131031/87896_1 /ASSEMBLY_ACC=CAM_ASM_000338 /TAXON_ID=268821 /ORGANISM="Scrippsiella Hangoei, Strain SHTV-5" /LENGTH=65 /DNA_ID=CAMNT_0050888747 /DNA_START=11 /DNA_END=208 /DNA_ORIENTATION=+
MAVLLLARLHGASASCVATGLVRPFAFDVDAIDTVPEQSPCEEARVGEIDSLNKAKAILSGADFA